MDKGFEYRFLPKGQMSCQWPHEENIYHSISLGQCKSKPQWENNLNLLGWLLKNRK